jgi:hypothetical protein
VRLFGRRDETLNEKLLREGGYSADGDPAEQHETELEAEAEAEPDDRVEFFLDDPDLPGTAHEFVTLADSSTIVDEDAPDITVIADAVEQDLEPPYRVSAAKQSDGFWLVTARPIRVETFALEGEKAELSATAGVTTYTVDGVQQDSGRVPSRLLAIGETAGPDFSVRAERIDGDLWEVSA